MHLIEDVVEDDGGEVEEPARPQHSRRDPGGDSEGDAVAPELLPKLFSRERHVHVLHPQSRTDCQAEIKFKFNIEVVQKNILKLPKIDFHDDKIVHALSPELGPVYPGLPFLLILDFAQHEAKIKVVETQD